MKQEELDDFCDDIEIINELPEWKSQIRQEVSEDYYYSLMDEDDWCDDEYNSWVKDAENEWIKNKRKEKIKNIFKI